MKKKVMKKVIIIILIVGAIFTVYTINKNNNKGLEETAGLNEEGNDDELENNKRVDEIIKKEVSTIKKDEIELDIYKYNDYENLELESAVDYDKEKYSRAYKQFVDGIYNFQAEIIIEEEIEDLGSIISISNLFVSYLTEDIIEENGKIIVMYNSSTLEEHKQKIDEFINRFNVLFKEVTKNDANELEIVLNVYTYWATTLSYDNDRVSELGGADITGMFDVISANKAVCGDYAKLIEYTLNQLDIECYYIEGETVGIHSWNIVKIYDDYYHIDATWEGQSGGLYFFGWSEEEMIETWRRVIDPMIYLDKKNNVIVEVEPPKADSEKLKPIRGADSYEIENHIITTYNENKEKILSMDTRTLEVLEIYQNEEANL